MDLQQNLDAINAEIKDARNEIMKAGVIISDQKERITELQRKARKYERLIETATKIEKS